MLNKSILVLEQHHPKQPTVKLAQPYGQDCRLWLNHHLSKPVCQIHRMSVVLQYMPLLSTFVFHYYLGYYSTISSREYVVDFIVSSFVSTSDSVIPKSD